MGQHHNSSSGGDKQDTLGLAAASAFGVALGEDGDALRADSGGGGARVSPLWRQRFFVQVKEEEEEGGRVMRFQCF